MRTPFVVPTILLAFVLTMALTPTLTDAQIVLRSDGHGQMTVDMNGTRIHIASPTSDTAQPSAPQPSATGPRDSARRSARSPASDTTLLPPPPAFPVIGAPAPAFADAHWLNVPLNSVPPAFGDGHVYVLNFTAMWCGPCKDVYPVLRELKQQFAAHDIRMLYGIARDGYGENYLLPASKTQWLAALPGYFAKHQVTEPVAVFDSLKGSWRHYTDNGKARQALPKLVVIDGQGIVRDVMSGWRGESSRRHLMADLTRLVATPAAASKP